MCEIKVIEKPADMSYKVISAVLKEAHQQHVDKGIVMRIPRMSPEELKKWVGEKGKCFVAMDGDKVVGTGSFMARELNRWYYKGKVAELTMQGVLPSHQGRHIFTALNKACEEAIEKCDFSAVYFDTALANAKRIMIGEKEGYALVDFFWTGNHYSVGMMKWFDGCPFSTRYCKVRYQLKRCAVYIKHFLGLYKN